jgi:hypothetical protein
MACESPRYVYVPGFTRQVLVEIFLNALSEGARRSHATVEVELKVRTLQRWLETDEVQPDRSPAPPWRAGQEIPRQPS